MAILTLIYSDGVTIVCHLYLVWLNVISGQKILKNLEANWEMSKGKTTYFYIILQKSKNLNESRLI